MAHLTLHIKPLATVTPSCLAAPYQHVKFEDWAYSGEDGSNVWKIVVDDVQDSGLCIFLTIDDGALPGNEAEDEYRLLHYLPTFPTFGAYNHAHLCKMVRTEQEPYDYEWIFEELPRPGGLKRWSPYTFALNRFAIHENHKLNVFEGTYPTRTETVVVKRIIAETFANWQEAFTFMENETEAYKVLQGGGVAPRFLGHLREHDQITGFVMEKIEGRRPGSDDTTACVQVLENLHHGDIAHRQFLIKSTGQAVVLDFETVEHNQGDDSHDYETDLLVKFLAFD